MKNKLIPLALAGFALAAAPAHAANVIVNGDFETGDFTGWTITGTGHSIESTTPLSGSHSALQVPSGGSGIVQSFTPITGVASTSFIFSTSDPGGAGDRSMNVYWEESGGTNRINLRVVDLDSDGDGDVQVFNGAWTTVLSDAVTFGVTTTLSLTINEYGAGSNYDLNVGGNAVTGLTDFQGGTLSDFGKMAFVNSSLAAGSTFEFDNVSAVPEPSAIALLGLSGLALLRRRR